MNETKFDKVFYIVETISCAIAIFCTICCAIALRKVELSGAQPSWSTLWGFVISTIAFETMAIIEFATQLMLYKNKGEN